MVWLAPMLQEGRSSREQKQGKQQQAYAPPDMTTISQQHAVDPCGTEDCPHKSQEQKDSRHGEQLGQEVTKGLEDNCPSNGRPGGNIAKGEEGSVSQPSTASRHRKREDSHCDPLSSSTRYEWDLNLAHAQR